MIVLDVDGIERVHLHRALADHIARHGIDNVPPRLTALCRQLAPENANPVDMAAVVEQAQLMTYKQAGARLNASARTLTRMVAAGELVKVGRRITTASVLSVGRPKGPRS